MAGHARSPGGAGPRRRPVRVAAGAALAVACALAVPAAAFQVMPVGSSPHDAITRGAALSAGWDEAAIPALQEATRRPDVDDVGTRMDGQRAVLDASADYEPAHHCDRVPPMTSAAALQDAGAYVRIELQQAAAFARGNATDRALRALGSALHALQDCYSHSDVVDRAGDADAFAAALLDDATWPAGLRVCGFLPGWAEAEFPPGDPYPHGSFNKDAPDSTREANATLPDGRTKHQAAALLAQKASAVALQRFLSGLSPAQKDAMFALRPSPQPAKVAAPGLPAALAVLCGAAFVCAAVRRQRR